MLDPTEENRLSNDNGDGYEEVIIFIQLVFVFQYLFNLGNADHLSRNEESK